ncbi:MAG: NAD(+) synthase, partial [Pseudomonadota bacterium]
KRHQRLTHARTTAETLAAPLVYVNMVGAQDELVYDGGSFAIDKDGKEMARNAYFMEDLNVVDINAKKGGNRQTPSEDIDHLYQALVLGIKDFVRKTGFKKAHLGLSGGIDSAVVACLLVDALGPQNVTAIALPSQFNSPISFELAKKLSENIGCHFFEMPISRSYEVLLEEYQKCFGEKEFSFLNENIQARTRGLFLMAYSNENGSMLMTTGNKTEYATGYATLYGDMCGGLAPIADLLKSQVFELAHYYNRETENIPEEIITRPPSAELRPNQKDSDSLPPYEELDQSVDEIVSHRQKPKSKTGEWLLNRLYGSEFKRWQSPPILKVSDHAFGQGRRMPLAHNARF